MEKNLLSQYKIPIWSHVYGGPASSGIIKTTPDDFIVKERLPFKPEGSGEHVFLYIEKCEENTNYVARLLAKFAGIKQRDVGYAGLKDRHARTRQWFSVWLPGKRELAWNQFETENIKILKTYRHTRKLKRGVLSGNQFTILVRHWQGDKDKVEQQLLQIQQQGIANYFGPQRFGIDGQNVNNAISMFHGLKVKRDLRSLYLSAARSYLFNMLLAERVRKNNWNQPLDGDVFIFDRSNSYFKTEQFDETIIQRIDSGQIHPTGVLFGKGDRVTKGEALNLENIIINNHKIITEGLEKYDLSIDRRALRVKVKNLTWKFQTNSSLKLTFSLPVGSYATSLLTEIVDYKVS